jgi:hypothetical protein
MANTYPFAKAAHREYDENSLPFPLTHKLLDRTPLNLPRFTTNDRNYVPDEALTASESSLASSDGENSSFSRSSYDPLENLEEYLKMRDQL